jgi:ADP-heptose:LPS heptosyltransferase
LTKFLIIRFSSIGDIVLTTPVVRCLKQQLPQTEIHFLTLPAFKSILAPNPYIDNVHVLDQPLLKKISELKQLGFDYIIDLHNNLRTRIIKSCLDIPAFSFDKLNVEKAQLVTFKQNTLPAIHIVDRYLATVQTFGVKNDGKGLDYFLPDDLLVNEQMQTASNQAYTAIAIGAQHATKRLPTQKLIEICTAITHRVVLLGGPEDQQIGAQIAAASGTHVINCCGSLSLHQSAWMVKQAQHIITHDTGLMHIAAAFKKHITSVWGNTVPELGMNPYYGDLAITNHQMQVAHLACRPCSKIGYKQCPKGHFNCMNLQDSNAIASSVHFA